MRYLVYIILFFITQSQSKDLILNFSKGERIDFYSITGVYDDVIIRAKDDVRIYGNFKVDADIDIDNPPNKDGIYQIALSSKGRFLHGGSYPNISFNGIRVHRGAIVIRKNGIWKRYRPRSIKFRGDLILENIQFENIHSPLDFIGKKANRKIKIVNSTFTNVSRVFATDRITSLDKWAESLSSKSVIDGYSFTSIVMKNNNFSNIKESIIWGTPTFRELTFEGNEIINSPNVTTILNLLPFRSDLIHDSQIFIANNFIENIMSEQERYSEVSRPLFRVISNTMIYRNTIERYNGIAFYCSGNNISIIENDLNGSGIKTKWPQNAVIMYKLLSNDKSITNNVLFNRVKNANGGFIHWSYANDFIVIGNYFHRINSPNTTNAVYNFETKNNPEKRLNMNLYSQDNDFEAETLLRFVGDTITPNLNIRSNDKMNIKAISSKKFSAKKVIISKKEYKHKK